MTQADDPFVSVIVPVFNDAERLRLCLQALENQTYLKHCYEVIVVDNASQEDIKPVVGQFQQAIAAYESQPGSYAARNTGLALAKGEVIAFTDADCIPASDWLEKGVMTLTSVPNCGMVGGRIDIFFRDENQATPIELYESLTAFPQHKLVQQQQFAATANVFTYKQVIERVGQFETTLKSGGDVEWGQRVAAAGYQLVYADEVRVAHPARHSWSQLFKRTVRMTGGLYDRHCRNGSSLIDRNKKYLLKLIESLVPPVNFVVNVFLNSSLRGIRQKLQVSAVMFFVRYVTAGELIRLKFGGVSVRD
jgi:glycosyltransferase involved in cell wall biosynthesis